MDEEPQSLLTFVRKLREVFDACDSDSDGLVRVAHFAQLGAQFGRAEQAKRLAGCLHPDSRGRIDFKDFCRGVFTMKDWESVQKPGQRTHHQDNEGTGGGPPSYRAHKLGF